jgi:hypothetical protein
MVIFHCYVSSPEGIKTENHLSVGLSEMLGRVIIFLPLKIETAKVHTGTPVYQRVDPKNRRFWSVQ